MSFIPAPRARIGHFLRVEGPGLALAGLLAILALVIARIQGVIPAAVIAVLLGVALQPHINLARLDHGLQFCASALLRIAVALLGLRLSLADVLDVGLPRLLGTAGGMVLTVFASLALARRLGCPAGTGLVMGAANAICGASASIAMAAALPERMRDTNALLLSVVLANGISTIAMLAYPQIAALLGFSPMQAGVFIGASIQDMAQVAGATTPLPAEAAKAGLTVKMFRVLMLLPVVLLFARPYAKAEGGTTPKVPGFALAFVGLCLLNSAVEGQADLASLYGPVKTVLGHLSTAFLLVALAAMGLKSSFAALARSGWRSLALFGTGSLTILLCALGVARFL